MMSLVSELLVKDRDVSWVTLHIVVSVFFFVFLCECGDGRTCLILNCLCCCVTVMHFKILHVQKKTFAVRFRHDQNCKSSCNKNDDM